MNLTQKIIHNTLAHAGGRMGGIFISVATVALMTRYLGQAGFGDFSTITAFIQMASVIGGLGLYLVTLRMLGDASQNQSEVFGSIISLRLASSGVLLAAIASIIWIFPYPTHMKIGILVFSLTAVTSAIDQIVVAGLQKHLSVGRTALAEITGKCIILSAVYGSAHFDLGLIAILSGYVCGSMVHMVINLQRVRTLIPFKLSFKIERWKEILKKGLPLAISNIFVIIYFKADTIFLSLFRSPAEVGIYGAPYQALETLISFAPMFMGLVLPHLAEHRDNSPEFSRIFQKAFDGLWIMACWFVATVIALAMPITLLIAGSQFNESAPVFRMLIIATAIIYLAHLTTYAITALDRQAVMLKYYGIAAMSAIVGYTILIPRYSYWAAATITVAVEFFILASSYRIIKNTIPLTLDFKKAATSLIAAMLTAGMLWQLRALPVVISITLSIFAYGILLHLFRVVRMQDLRAMIFPSKTDSSV